MAEPIVVNVGWVVKLLEGWTNKYSLIYAGLTDEVFWVSAAKAGVWLIKAEKDVLVWKQGSVLKENFERKFLLLPKLTSWKFFINVSTLCSSFWLLAIISPHTLTFPFRMPGYLFEAHTLAVQQFLQALVIAPFCVGLVKDMWCPAACYIINVKGCRSNFYGVVKRQEEPSWISRNFLLEQGTR